MQSNTELHVQIQVVLVIFNWFLFFGSATGVTPFTSNNQNTAPYAIWKGMSVLFSVLENIGCQKKHKVFLICIFECVTTNNIGYNLFIQSNNGHIENTTHFYSQKPITTRTTSQGVWGDDEEGIKRFSWNSGQRLADDPLNRSIASSYKTWLILWRAIIRRRSSNCRIWLATSSPKTLHSSLFCSGARLCR